MFIQIKQAPASRISTAIHPLPFSCQCTPLILKNFSNDDLNSNFNNIWLIDAGALDHRRWKSFNLDKEAEKLMCEACSEETQKADEKQITWLLDLTQIGN